MRSSEYTRFAPRIPGIFFILRTFLIKKTVLRGDSGLTASEGQPVLQFATQNYMNDFFLLPDSRSK